MQWHGSHESSLRITGALRFGWVPPTQGVRVSVGIIGVTRESHGSVEMIGVSGTKSDEKANETFRNGNLGD